MAQAAIGDLIHQFWIGDSESGHLYDARLWKRTNGRGYMWQRATAIFALEDMYQTTLDPKLRKQLVSDWMFLRSVFTPQELMAVGPGATGTASDDAGWTILLYLAYHRVTGDPKLLKLAGGLFKNSDARWADGTFGGGIWYSDKRDIKSLYQAAQILGGIRLYELTGDRYYWDRAVWMYNWVESHLLRDDGLYWCDYRAGGPRTDGGEHEAGSVTFLGGNMAMGVIHARMYRDTGDPVYRDHALRTAKAIRQHETDGKGHYVDDRDAWTNGTFAGEWAAEVLTLPGITKEDLGLMRDTATSVATKARTSDGYYSACWDGPADGQGCPWVKAGSLANQIMVSSNSVNMIVAGAAVGIRQPAPPVKQPS